MLTPYIEDLKKSIKRTEKEILRIEEDIGLERIIKSDIKYNYSKKKKYEKAVEDAKISLEKLNVLLNEYNSIVFGLSMQEQQNYHSNKKLNKIEAKFMNIFIIAKKNLL